jgi:hexosaminidase
VLKSHPELIKGIQANVWTETIHSGERLDFMVYPRIVALAEAAWAIKSSDAEEFLKRLQPSFRLYKAKGISFFNPENPESTPEIKGIKK